METYNIMKSISLIQQQIKLKKTYPDMIERIGVSCNELTCLIKLQPTKESITYKVMISYKLDKWPQARLVYPKEIAKVNGEKPHHLYNRDVDGKEKLCVFDSREKEWNDRMFLANSFVPWIITWLSAYEIWQITGVWVYPEAKITENKPIVKMK